MSIQDRLYFSLRAIIGGFITALILGAIVYLALDLQDPAEMSKLAFWSVLCVLFVATIGFAFAGAAFIVNVVVGAIAGFVFCFVAIWPQGFFPGRFETPVILLWPCVGLGAFAYASSRVHKQSTARGPGWLPLIGMAATVLLVIGIKVGFARIAQPLDFARYKSDIPQPRIDKVIAANPAARADSCRGAPLGARLLSDAGIGIDSTVAIKPFGSYSDLRTNSSGQRFGYRISMWTTGDVSHGFIEQFSGDSTGNRAMLEQVQYDENRVLHMQAHFADGYAAKFEGSYNAANLQGTLKIVDGTCDARVLTTDRVVLTQEFNDSLSMFGATQRKTLRDFAQNFAHIYRREPAPSFPDPPILAAGLFIADRFNYGEATTAASVSARFMTVTDLNRHLDPKRVVGNAGATPLALTDVMFARAVDRQNNLASWIVVGPKDVVKKYLADMHAALASKDGVQHFSYRMLPLQFL